MTEIYSGTVLVVKSPKPRCWQGRALSDSSRGGFFLASSSFWWLPAVHGIPWLVDASLQAQGHLLTVCLHIIFPLCTNFPFS